MSDKNNAFAILGFAAPALINLIDEMEGTTAYKQQLKFHLNRASTELQKINADFYKHHESASPIIQDGQEIPLLDIYAVTMRAYYTILTMPPAKIASIVELINQMDAKGMDVTKLNIPYQPIEK